MLRLLAKGDCARAREGKGVIVVVIICCFLVKKSNPEMQLKIHLYLMSSI